MASWNSITLMVAAAITFLSTAEGFFLYSNSNKKTSNERVMPPPNYYRDVLPPGNGWGAQYAFDGAGPMTVALPVAVPIQAQMAQSLPPSLKGSVHNVQLVPCLCPVTRDVDSAYLSPMSQQQQQQQQQLQQAQNSYIVQANSAQPQST